MTPATSRANGVPLILLTGMAADERLFEPQLERFPQLKVPAWISPLPGESLRAYAARFAPLIDPGCPCIVGGASFGGMVALEMAAHLPALACVLIGSVRSPRELSWRWRMLRPLACFGPDNLGKLADISARLGRRVLRRGMVRRLERLSQPHAAFVRWAMCAVLRWQPSPAARQVKIFQIHGDADCSLPVALTRPDVVVAGGGHALTLFSPQAVNEFLARVIDQVLVRPPS